MITLAGLGPGDFDRIPSSLQALLLDPAVAIVVRTRAHPAAEQLAARREIVDCDDLYRSRGTFEDVYAEIASRVIGLSEQGPVVYAVPGSPLVGEFAVRRIIASGVEYDLIPAESFVDIVLAEAGYDPLDRGLQILNGHDLPDPLVLDKPTIIGHLDRPEILAEVSAAVARVLEEDVKIHVMVDLGSRSATVVEVDPSRVAPSLAGLRTSLFIDGAPGGLIGAVHTMRRLRAGCPWDKEQTHRSLVKNLVEEVYEFIDAVQRLPDGDVDWVAYAEVEEELGDVLLQVLFHDAIAREAGAFDIDGVAEVMRQKLVRRHPHVFGDVEVASAAEVKANWDRIKQQEKGGSPESALDGVPAGMPALHRSAKIQNRAAKVGFDWDSAARVIPKIREEIDELEADIDDPGRAAEELGDILFSVVNLARHLGIDCELALVSATTRFEGRFRAMEADGPLAGLTLAELDERWERAKGDS